MQCTLRVITEEKSTTRMTDGLDLCVPSLTHELKSGNVPVDVLHSYPTEHAQENDLRKP